MNKHKKSPIGVEVPFRAKNLVMLLSSTILSLQVQAGVTSNPPPPAPPKANPPCKNSGGNGMAICIVDDNIHASLRIIDTPLLNTATIGPETSFQLSYVSRGLFDIYDGSAGGNIGVGWWHNWRAWIEDGGTPIRPPVSINSRDRGNHYYSGFNEASGTFTPEPQTQAVLQWVPESPQRYIRRLPDGSMEIYQHLYIAKNESRRFMLSAVVDKFGNSVKLNYDTSSRLISLTDAVGRVTRFDYQNQAFPERITQVTDFGGRSIQLKYTDTGNLQSITDVIGIESRFNYVADGVIDALTTPYGTTRFESGREGYYWWLQVTDPMGNKERQEFLHGAPGIPFSVDNSELPDAPGLFNQYINARNSYHWNKTTMRQMGNSRDYTRAHIKHWLHATNDVSTPIGVLESEKAPLESRVWYTYANQVPGMASSTSHQPIAVARKMPDGSTQLEKYEYSGTGNLTKRIDPVGRVTEWTYHPNGTDVATVRQSAGVQQEMIVQSEYDAHHLPVAVTNAGGGTSRFSYNQFGQVISETNPAGEVLKYEYDNQGQLVRVINQEGRIQISYQWDAMGRVASQTDAEGYTVRHSYDALNRKIRSEYPDDTAEVFEWRALDLIAQTNRAGQTTRFEYDANRRLIAKTDPSGTTLRYEYDPDGNLTALTDGKGQTTRWDRDIQGRVIRKIFPGGGIIQYQYDSVGRLVSQIDVAGNKASLSWTIDNQLAGKTYQPAAGSAPVVNVSYQYDTLHPRITRMLDSSGVTEYTYQPSRKTDFSQLSYLYPGIVSSVYSNSSGMPPSTGQVSSETNRLNETAAAFARVNYQYDGLGRRTQMSINDTYQMVYAYDKLGRIDSVKNMLGNVAYQYEGDTQRISSTSLQKPALQKALLRNNALPTAPLLLTTYEWGSLKQNRQLKKIRFGTDALDQSAFPANGMYPIEYQFDTLGRLAKKTENNTTDEFSYDAASRLTGITSKKNGAWFGKASGFYAYDEADNIVRLQDNSGKLQFTHNTDNFL